MKEEYGIDSGIITGRKSDEAVEAYNKMKHGDLRLIFATVGCVSTGISISDLDNLVLISPIYTNTLLLHQIRGRLMRNSPDVP
jgi:superfamily II DNA or RNA helicase